MVETCIGEFENVSGPGFPIRWDEGDLGTVNSVVVNDLGRICSTVALRGFRLGNSEPEFIFDCRAASFADAFDGTGPSLPGLFTETGVAQGLEYRLSRACR